YRRSERERTYDVLIIGAGMAGGCLARQLRLEQPDLRIAVIDRKTTFDWWVGESTVEVWYDYAVRVLKLGPYLAERHLLKHGLRFFFDSERHDLTIPEMSESGRAHYPGNIPAVQLDRAKLDADLCEMNRNSGVDVFLGTRVLGREGEPVADYLEIDGRRGHRVETNAG